MKKLTILTVFILSYVFVCGQVSLERQVIGTTGNYSTAGTISVSSTVGEAVTKTAISGSIVLTQGFQQPNQEDLVSVEDDLKIILNYNIFPNPTQDVLNVELTTDRPVKLGLEVIDARGRMTDVEGRLISVQGTTSTTMSLQTLADGVYTLVLKNEAGAMIKTFKVQKVH